MELQVREGQAVLGTFPQAGRVCKDCREEASPPAAGDAKTGETLYDVRVRFYYKQACTQSQLKVEGTQYCVTLSGEKGDRERTASE